MASRAAHRGCVSKLRTPPAGGQGLSRYVEVEVKATREELLVALTAQGLEVQTDPQGRRIMLEGSLECAGQPVDLRLAPGSLGAVEDFGFVVEEAGLRLVCGDVDLSRLEAKLLAPLKASLAQAKLDAAGIESSTIVEADGTHRIVVRRK